MDKKVQVSCETCRITTTHTIQACIGFKATQKCMAQIECEKCGNVRVVTLNQTKVPCFKEGSLMCNGGKLAG